MSRSLGRPLGGVRPRFYRSSQSGPFGLAYFASTILPCLDHSCPYPTPMSSLWWISMAHFPLLCCTLSSFYFDAVSYLPCVIKFGRGDVTLTAHTHPVVVTIENFAEMHGKRLKHGFRGIVVEYARETSLDHIDVEALTWLFQLPAPTEKSKIQKFVASLPGETIIQLLSKSFQDGKVSFRHRLSTLFRSCIPGTAASELDENMRHRRLLVCLNASITLPRRRLLHHRHTY